MNYGPIRQDNIYKILDLISNSPLLSQRKVADSTGLSLGLVNLILKRLVKTGYIKVSSLNKKRVKYILTSKGALEKYTQTYKYVSGTVQTFLEYQKNLSTLIDDLRKNASKKGDTLRFAILGNGDISSLLEFTLHTKYPDIHYRILGPAETPEETETVLDCRFKGTNAPVGISVLNKLIQGSSTLS
ncbi:MAG TPA: winged helix-turn-helix transcriptional regulator [Elusimicrobiota bacterium]|nr:winged helix-turn-helix transcriptional regulator [Elusimicrobiota bacterium]